MDGEAKVWRQGRCGAWELTAASAGVGRAATHTRKNFHHPRRPRLPYRTIQFEPPSRVPSQVYDDMATLHPVQKQQDTARLEIPIPNDCYPVGCMLTLPFVFSFSTNRMHTSESQPTFSMTMWSPSTPREQEYLDRRGLSWHSPSSDTTRQQYVQQQGFQNLPPRPPSPRQRVPFTPSSMSKRGSGGTQTLRSQVSRIATFDSVR